jgi:hypothetical protein
VFRQYYAQRFRRSYPLKSRKARGGQVVFSSDPRDKQIGTIPVGTIVYIQDGVRPLQGLTKEIVRREPWMVEAWLPRDYSKWDDSTRSFKTVRGSGGHLAIVRSLRDRNRVQSVADWILLACIDSGLEKLG